MHIMIEERRHHTELLKKVSNSNHNTNIVPISFGAIAVKAAPTPLPSNTFGRIAKASSVARNSLKPITSPTYNIMIEEIPTLN